MVEEQISNWLGNDFPFWLVALCSLCVVLGQLIADWNNPGSWLRSKLNNARRLFDMEGPWPTSQVVNGKEYFFLAIKLKFAKNIQCADLLMKVYFCVKPGESKFRFSKRLDFGQRFAKDDERKYVLAVIPKSFNESAWCGPFDDKEKESITHGSKNILQISLSDGARTQTRKIYLEMFLPGSGTGGRFSFIEEESPLFRITEDKYSPSGIRFMTQ